MASRKIGETLRQTPAHRVNGRVRLVLVPAALALVLATPVAIYWLIGPLSSAQAHVRLHYAYRPWPVGPAVSIAATILAVISLALLIWATARQRLDARWWKALIPLLVAGFIVGAGYRVLTAGLLPGVNIGAGFVMMIGAPLVLILVAWAVGYAFVLGWGQSPPGPQGPPPDLLAWARAVDVSRVTEQTADAAENYLRDYPRMTALAGRELGLRIASILETQVSPSPPLSLSPSDIAAAVLAVRRKQLGIEDWPGWAGWPGRSDWAAWADWPGWNRKPSTSPQ
jgi:hypothetical protein